VTWVFSGKYALYVALLPPQRSEALEKGGPGDRLQALSVKLAKLPEIYQGINPDRRPIHSEMEELHWVEIGGFAQAATSQEATFETSFGMPLKVAISIFFKTVCRVRVLTTRLTMLSKTGMLLEETPVASLEQSILGMTLQDSKPTKGKNNLVSEE